MARMQAAALAEFLTRPVNAVIATMRREGRPYLVPVWFLWEPSGERAAGYPFYPEGVFWLTGTYTRQWCKHLFREPRLSLCVEGGGPVPGYVAADCRAEPIEPKDADIWPVSAKLVDKYVGARGGPEAAARFLANMRTEPRLLFRLTPERWRAIDLTVYTGSRGDLEYQRARTNPPLPP
jgi:PPOX class probable F420-dependent enzyme